MVKSFAFKHSQFNTNSISSHSHTGLLKMNKNLPTLKRTDSKTVDPRWPWSQEQILNQLVENNLIQINKDDKIEAKVGQMETKKEGRSEGNDDIEH